MLGLLMSINFTTAVFIEVNFMATLCKVAGTQRSHLAKTNNFI